MEGVTGSGPGTSGSDNQVTDQAKQQTQRLAQQARQQAGQLANRGSEQVKSQLDNQKHQAAQRMVPVQSALRETAHQLRSQGQGPMAQYADRTSDQVERFSGYLRETDVDEIIDEVRGFARRRPAIFLGSAATLGFLVARFLKSSSQEAVSAGGGSSATGGGAPSQGIREPATVHRGIAEGPAQPAAPAGGQPLEDRYAQVERSEPPRRSQVERSEPPRSY